ncbi:MAG: AAA family ATPase [Eubacterium sp.]|nr:AAA family ATPase [Eubacterium sp.]
MTELINRPEYLKQLIQNKDVDLIKIVIGIRRCGKSSLLDLFHSYLTENGVPDDNIIHMNLESLKYRNLKNYLGFYDYVSERITKDGKALSKTQNRKSKNGTKTKNYLTIKESSFPYNIL